MHISSDLEPDNKTTYYLIPANVTARFEIFPGVGWKEAKYVAIALVIGFLIYAATGMITKTVQYNVKDLPLIETIGLSNDKNTVIDGDIIKRKVEVIPKGIRLLFILILGAGTFFVVKGDPTTGLSLITSLQAIKEFNKRQRRYLYKYNSGGTL